MMFAQIRRCGLIPARAGKTPGDALTGRGDPAHPRAGGENPPALIATWWAGGSSPRGRGKPELTMEDATALGLIPARAGKTTSGRMTRASRRAHPRAGGENRLVAWLRSGGSGLIPARAGKTRDRTRRGTNRRAHPRAGGENQLSHVDLEGIVGSSPRGRGKHQSTVEQPVQGRLIPARAGKTSSPRPRISAEPAHPRAGGENAALVQ